MREYETKLEEENRDNTKKKSFNLICILIEINSTYMRAPPDIELIFNEQNMMYSVQ